MECTADKKAASRTARDAEDKWPCVCTGPSSKSPTLQRIALSDGDLRLGHDDDDYTCSPADLALARDLWTTNHPCVAAIDLPLADRQDKEHPARQNFVFSSETGAANRTDWAMDSMTTNAMTATALSCGHGGDGLEPRRCTRSGITAAMKSDCDSDLICALLATTEKPLCYEQRGRHGSLKDKGHGS